MFFYPINYLDELTDLKDFKDLDRTGLKRINLLGKYNSSGKRLNKFLTDQDMLLLGEALSRHSFPELVEINISDNLIGDEGIKILVGALCLCHCLKFSKFVLHGNLLGPYTDEIIVYTSLIASKCPSILKKSSYLPTSLEKIFTKLEDANYVAIVTSNINGNKAIPLASIKIKPLFPIDCPPNLHFAGEWTNNKFFSKTPPVIQQAVFIQDSHLDEVSAKAICCQFDHTEEPLIDSCPTNP